MEISQIVIENRPRLQCANFFIQFSDHFFSQDAVKLSVKPDKITITIENDRYYQIELKPHFNLHTRTLSQLVIKKDYINFRINTNECEFSTELLKVKEINANNENFKLNPLNLVGDESYDIKCSNCENVFAKEHKFSRILELPSDNIDMAEWFCHKPHDMKPNSLNPGVDEVFYGLFFFLLNTENLLGLRFKGKLTYCKRCLQFLGELNDPKKKDSIKLWNDSVTFSNISLFPNTLVENFTFLLKKLHHEFTFDLPGLPQIFKTIFQCTLSNGRQNFLLIQVMDHNLDVLRLKDGPGMDLEPLKAVKLLFKFEQDRDNPLVKFWLDCTNINTVQISPRMFLAALEHLNQMSRLIAECYRTSQSFVLSYLNI